jgi:sporulation protein YlmC with PRC-barrel domain
MNFYETKPQERVYMTKARCSGKSFESLINNIKAEIQLETKRHPFGVLSHSTDFMDAISYSLAGYRPEWLTTDGKELKEENKYMKIEFRYTNGKSYTATGVTTYRDPHDHVYYNQVKDTGLLKTNSDIEVSKSDLLAYVVYDGNATTIVKVGNCKLNFDIEDLSKHKVKKYGRPRGVRKEGGWIDWEGGECPVAGGTLVDVKHRDGGLHFNERAACCGAAHIWWHSAHAGDIVAYRLSKGE